MKTTKILFILIVTFVLFNIPVNAQNYYGIHFMDCNTGLAGGDGGMLQKTSDGGNYWNTISSPTSSDIKNFELLNNGNVISIGSSGSIINSTDYGDTWTSGKSYVTSDLNGISFYPKTNLGVGIIVGDNGFVLRSDNGGSSWTTIMGKENVNFTSVTLHGDNGILVGERGTILITNDAGLTWRTPGTILMSQVDLKYVCLVSDNQGYATGANGTILKTIDGGDSWIICPTGINNTITKISFFDENTTIACGDNGKILMSYDGGLSWTEQESGILSDLNCLYVTSADHAYAAGNHGTLIKTTDAGRSWITLKSSNVSTSGKMKMNTQVNSKEIVLSQNYPNPFNPTTNINYQLSFVGQVVMKVYNLAGQEVQTLVNEMQNAGTYTARFNAASLASGIYIYKLTAMNGEQRFEKIMKMILVK